MKRANKTILVHFVGIGGIGMSGIAEVLYNQGYQVSGSDIAESKNTRRLVKMGIKIQIGHKSENVLDSDVVVISSAVKEDNPEVKQAKKLHIPVIPRAEMLAELMRGKTGIAVAGSHGKTTTASMVAAVLTEAQLDPTLVIGGIVASLGGNAKLGQGEYFVAEADESDGSFLALTATYAIVTNIDNDHLDYFKTVGAIDQAFVDFVGNVPFYGFAAVCGDDSGVKRCLPAFSKPVVTYGLSAECDFYATAIETEGLHSNFHVHHKKEDKTETLGKIQLPCPGQHNVLNALGVISICIKIGVSFEVIKKALSEFKGVARRFEIRWQDKESNRMIVDDYGHHPTEIAATIGAARKFWNGRIISVFQPHRYTRTEVCMDLFVDAFVNSDIIFITDIYPAGEEPIAGVTSKELVKRMLQKSDQKIYHVPSLEDAKKAVIEQLDSGDLVLCLGAGSIAGLPNIIIDEIK